MLTDIALVTRPCVLMGKMVELSIGGIVKPVRTSRASAPPVRPVRLCECALCALQHTAIGHCRC